MPLDPREPLAPGRAVGDDLALRAAHARDLAAELVAAVLQVLVGELRAASSEILQDERLAPKAQLGVYVRVRFSSPKPSRKCMGTLDSTT